MFCRYPRRRFVFLRGSLGAGGPREATGWRPGSSGTGTGFVKGFLCASEANPACHVVPGAQPFPFPLASDAVAAGRAADPPCVCMREGGAGRGAKPSLTLFQSRVLEGNFSCCFGANLLAGSKSSRGSGRETGKAAFKNSKPLK